MRNDSRAARVYGRYTAESFGDIGMIKATPGPWVTYGHRNLSVMSEFTVIDIGSANRYEANAEANACLFAAAPDLLAACIGVVESQPGTINRAFDAVRAAIAKAGGKP